MFVEFIYQTKCIVFVRTPSDLFILRQILTIIAYNTRRYKTNHVFDYVFPLNLLWKRNKEVLVLDINECKVCFNQTNKLSFP